MLNFYPLAIPDPIKTLSFDYNTVLGALIKHTFTSKVDGN
jgi:hypothetical protein